MAQNSEHPPYSVGLVELGDRLRLNLDRLACDLNKLQCQYRFQVAGSVPRMPLDMLRNRAYNFRTLHSGLRDFGQTPPYDYVVGVTDQRVAGEEDGQTYENYYSRSDFEGTWGWKVGVITVHKKVAQHRGPRKTMYQYLGFLLMCEVLILRAKKDLSRPMGDYSLFDETEELEMLSDCIDAAFISDQSKKELLEAGVRQCDIEAAESVLPWCKRNHWGPCLKYALSHPLLTAGLSAAIGWGAGAYLTQDYLPYVVAAVFAGFGVALLHGRFWLK